MLSNSVNEVHFVRSFDMFKGYRLLQDLASLLGHRASEASRADAQLGLGVLAKISD
jgi:hypothetical protein